MFWQYFFTFEMKQFFKSCTDISGSFWVETIKTLWWKHDALIGWYWLMMRSLHDLYICVKHVQKRGLVLELVPVSVVGHLSTDCVDLRGLKIGSVYILIIPYSISSHKNVFLVIWNSADAVFASCKRFLFLLLNHPMIWIKTFQLQFFSLFCCNVLFLNCWFSKSVSVVPTVCCSEANILVRLSYL